MFSLGRLKWWAEPSVVFFIIILLLVIYFAGIGARERDVSLLHEYN